ncbi:MAG: hypothetical protein AAGG51_22835 [Cyanobacteria bacterium P01_G01_bin.54]
MLSRHRRPISLSWTALNLPVQTDVETLATLYPKDRDRFHLFLRYPSLAQAAPHSPLTPLATQGGGLWLEISPHRVIMTLQGRNYQGYRHFWERGVYGRSRYWIQGEAVRCRSALCLRNFTRSLQLYTLSLPQYLRLEYELWSDKLSLGCYQLEIDIHQ